MPCTEAYKEHIEYTFNAFCRVVIHYAAINAWRDRDKRRQREISFEYLTEEKFYPFCTSDTYFIDPYKQYPVTICGQRVILTNGNLAEALSSLPEKKREIIYLYFFGRYTQQEIGEMYGRCRSTTGYQIRRTLQLLHKVSGHETADGWRRGTDRHDSGAAAFWIFWLNYDILKLQRNRIRHHPKKSMKINMSCGL